MQTFRTPESIHIIPSRTPAAAASKTFSILAAASFKDTFSIISAFYLSQSHLKTFSIPESESLLPLYNVKREEASEASCERSELIHRNDRI